MNALLVTICAVSLAASGMQGVQGRPPVSSRTESKPPLTVERLNRFLDEVYSSEKFKRLSTQHKREVRARIYDRLVARAYRNSEREKDTPSRDDFVLGIRHNTDGTLDWFSPGLDELIEDRTPSKSDAPPRRGTRTPGSGALPRADTPDCEAGHWIVTVADDGKIVKLEDSSVWRVPEVDAVTSMLWLPADEIVTCKGKLINTDDSETVSATRLR